jgi:hypothetical protein
MYAESGTKQDPRKPLVDGTHEFRVKSNGARKIGLRSHGYYSFSYKLQAPKQRYLLLDGCW